MDKMREKIEGLKLNRLPIYKLGREEKVLYNLADGRLTLVGASAKANGETAFSVMGAAESPSATGPGYP